MRIHVQRTSVRFCPDFKRVILRFHRYNDERVKFILKKVMRMSAKEVNSTLHATLREFAKRHRSISRIFEKHFDQVKHLLDESAKDEKKLSLKESC